MRGPTVLHLLILSALVALLAAACGADPTPTPTARPAATPTPTATAAPTTEPEPTAEPGTQVAVVAHPTYGSILADADGRILYLFTRDERMKSTCEGGCLTNWPLLTTEATPVAGEGVVADRLGTTTATNGETQVTYNGWPLYYFANDAAPGDANGQDRGDVWFVMSPLGGPVYTSAPVNLSSSGAAGPHIVDGDGRVQYLYTKDEKNVSNCSGNCALNWPPLLTINDPAPGDGVAADRIGVIDRADGSKQVTYNGWPLYYFANDEKPGDTVGQDRGGVWYLVSSDGGAIRTSAVVNVAEGTAYGTILSDESGRVLYLYTRDEPGVSNCSGNCALNWPPFLTVDDPGVVESLDPGLLGETSRSDGARQVTYNEWPLYYYVNDEKPGDLNGQGRGEVWYVLNMAGELTTEQVEQPIVSDIRNFQLEDLTVRVGQTVTWVNRDTAPHTATSNDSGVFDTGTLQQGAGGSHTFTTAGTFGYFCDIHPSMTATVTVVE